MPTKDCQCAICGTPAFSKKADPRGLCATHHRRLVRFGTVEPTVMQRLLAKVDQSGPGGCWLWTGGTTSHGYGRFNNMSTHRIAYEAVKGSIPRGMEIDHICHVTLCVNPGHLRITTPKQNRENRPTSWSATGIRGVRFRKGKWEGCVVHNRKYVYCGRFDSAGAAEAAVKAKRLELFTHNDADRAA